MAAQRTASIRTDSRYARWPVIGMPESIGQMSADFYHTWYQLNNMHLMIIGDIQPKETVAMIENKIAAMNKPIVDSIIAQDVQNLLEQWFKAKNRIVQYQSPRMAKIEAIHQAEFDCIAKQVSREKLSAPIKKEVLLSMSLAPLTSAQGKIVATEDFPAENVVHWTLENGDKVVWLKSALANDRTFFRAVNSAGFMAQGLSPWQSQMAVQMIAQSSPENWQVEQLVQWKKDHKVSLNPEQKAENLTFSGETDNAHFADLLRLHYALEREISITDSVDETIEDMQKMLKARAKNAADREISEAQQRLRFGKLNTDTLPTERELNGMTATSLNQQWDKIRALPTTYYIVNNQFANEVKGLVQTYLATLPRSRALNVQTDAPLKGTHQAVLKTNVRTTHRSVSGFLSRSSVEKGRCYDGGADSSVDGE